MLTELSKAKKFSSNGIILKELQIKWAKLLYAIPIAWNGCLAHHKKNSFNLANQNRHLIKDILKVFDDF